MVTIDVRTHASTHCPIPLLVCSSLVSQCKLYHVVKARTHGWVIADKPNFMKEYCHPFKHNNKDLYYPKYTLDYFTKSVELFRDLVKLEEAFLPTCLLFNEERFLSEPSTVNKKSKKKNKNIK